MKLTCTGRKVNLKDTFIDRVNKRFAKLDKFFSDSAEAQVTVTVEKDWQTVEITIKDKGLISRAEKDAERMEDAFDAAADVLERRVIKNRKKLADRVQQPAVTEMAAEINEDSDTDDTYNVIREKHFATKPTTVDEAILEMNMLGHEFFLFRDAETDEIQAVYRRKNGTYGLLIPEND